MAVARVRSGGAWVAKTPKARSGGAWVDKATQHRSSGIWSAPSDALTSGLLAQNGAWTWFTDPRAVIYQGVMYTGLVSSSGDIRVTALDLTTRALTAHTLANALEAMDDHDNPAVFIRPDQKIVIFYSQHSNDNLVRYRISTNALDISAWGAEQTLALVQAAYSNPHYVSAQSRLFFFCRGVANLQPKIAYNTSQGDPGSWTSFAELFASGASFPRAYVKYNSNGVDRIDFWATACHPNEGSAGEGHIYHWYYSAVDSAFHKTDGTLTKTLATVMAGTPLTPADVTKVHDAVAENGGGNGNGWTHSIEYDAAGRPVVTYAVFVATDDNRYRYARWDGSSWVKSGDILTGVSSLYGTGAVAEQMYTGGIVVDPRNTNRLYVSTKTSGQWEIERWITGDGGATWPTKDAITAGSGANKNFRPYCPRNWISGAPAVLFCRGTYTTYNSFAASQYGSPDPAVAAPAAPPAGDLSDTATDTNGTNLADHVSDSGHRWTQHPLAQAQSAVVSSGRIRPSAATSAMAYFSNWVPTTADYSVSATVSAQSATGSIGVMGRVDTAINTWYFFRRNSVGGVWQLFKNVAGVTTQLGSSVAGAAGVAKLEMIGTAITGYVDGVSTVAVTDSAITAKGRAGVQGSGGGTDATGHQLDNVTVANI